MIGGIGGGGYNTAAMNSSMRGRSAGPDPAKVQEKLFKTLDGNGDGGIDKTEFSAALQSVSQSSESASTGKDTYSLEDIFATIDSNSDGTLSQDETSAAMDTMGPPPGGPGGMEGMGGMGAPPSADQMFSNLDSNGDGGIDKAELSSALPRGQGDSSDIDALFSQVDTDSDGTISKAENSSWLEAMRSQSGTSEATGAQGPMGPPPPPPSGAAGSSDSSSASSNSSFDKLDTNKDGTVSLQELLAATDTSQSSGSANRLDEGVSKMMQQLLKTYGGTGDAASESSRFSAAA